MRAALFGLGYRMQQDTASFLNGGNAAYVAELHARFTADPKSVDPGWAAFFTTFDTEDAAALRNGNGCAAPATVAGISAETPETAEARILDSLRALMLIRLFRERGHLHARLDPLGLARPPFHSELDFRTHGFSDADLDKPIFIGAALGNEAVRNGVATLREILRILEETYCGTVGVEYLHIQDPEQKAWVQKRVESIRNRTEFTERGKQAILERLTEAEGFERFLQLKYTGTKRFGLEGGEALIPALEQIMKRSGQLGVREIVLGMAHRGRLNVLTNLMQKPPRAIFSEFQGNPALPGDVQGSGDVKYHLGTSAVRDFGGVTVSLSLTSNPSHLEAVDPVVLGKVRAKQTQGHDVLRDGTMGVLIHGDAAFAGQGVVAECFAMSQLEGYSTGGTIHVVVNNQIGFTTAPRYSRSGPYCTDVAKMVQAPIFHVNGDDAEAVVHVARIAAEFRQTFKSDVVLDMVCYRRHGHNEGDEPAFTQPLMYRRIAKHPTVRQIYGEALVKEGVLAEAEVQAMVAKVQSRLEAEFEASKSFKVDKADWLDGKWAGLGVLEGEEEMREERTDADTGLLRDIGESLAEMPKGMHAHPKVLRQIEARRQRVREGGDIDWSTAEALAIGSLLVEGTPVRLAGQDSRRGTFSQRHSVLVDQERGVRYVPLNRLRPGQAHLEAVDSLLSEEAALGFEFGYTLTAPNSLVMWEAQFGDFANGAQVVIDQFIASSEAKWLRMSGLTLLLPHGYEGQGPEHSSARLERYLQLCAEDNMQVCNLTTPANYFHALRRQVRRNFRKPLVVMTPKSLLRHKLAVSTLAAMGTGSRFRRVLPETETLVADDRVTRVILCSGKVYYDLFEERARRGLDHVAIIRVEQLYPWPKETLKNEVGRYPNAEIVWCQEEPANMGAWMFVDRRIEYLLEELMHQSRRAVYVGRKAGASTATGLLKNHLYEQAELIDHALSGVLFILPQPFRKMTSMALLQSQAKQQGN